MSKSIGVLEWQLSVLPWMFPDSQYLIGLPIEVVIALMYIWFIQIFPRLKKLELRTWCILKDKKHNLGLLSVFIMGHSRSNTRPCTRNIGAIMVKLHSKYAAA